MLRRISQFMVLGMFLSGPWLGFWVLHGNYSSSLLFDTLPLTDPLITWKVSPVDIFPLPWR